MDYQTLAQGDGQATTKDSVVEAPAKFKIGSISIFFIALIIGRLSSVIKPLHLYNPDHNVASSVTTSTTNPNLQDHTVLITGATGRTGSLLYSTLSASNVKLRALVRNADKAREVLNCTSCDERDGIFVGDVTRRQDLIHAARGVDTLVILAATGMGDTPEQQRAVEFDAVVSSVAALAQEANTDVDGKTTRHLRVVLCSSMGTTFLGGDIGDILFWKLNAEAFLGTAGIGSTIVKPCGLTHGVAGNSTLLVGHNDSLLNGKFHSVSREDVAAVMAQAVLSRSQGLRFDLCSMPGPGTTDLGALLAKSRWSWDN